MKKRGIASLLITLIALVVLNTSFSLAAYGNGVGPCYETSTNRHTEFFNFDSDPFYDAVEICGLCYACDEIPDGICPEDYGEVVGLNVNRASCTNHPDGDCVARVSGTVKTLEDGQVVSGALITTVAPPSSTLEPVTILTDGRGEFFIEEIPAGRWIFKVEKEGLDTVISEEILEYGKTNHLNFLMPKGTCNRDCTNAFGRCSADCDGINGCVYPSPLVRELCDDLLPGTEVIINETGEFVYKYVCCNRGDINDPILEYRPRATVHGDMEQLVIRETVVRMNNDVVKIKLAIWQ